MDYVFFGFSSLCLALTILFIFVLSVKADRQLRFWQYLAAGAASVLLYYLNVVIFSSNVLLYFLSNSLPQLALTVVLTLLLRYKSTTG
ncbi:MAG: hypothetical protein GX173_11225 [Ruminococcaceae bacterium]|nr:hypothetical protein [Oscillospiraceae bacterium]